MNDLLSRIRMKRWIQKRESAPRQHPNPKREKTIPPHIVACKLCGGKGMKEGEECPQCQGSGRVIVSCEVTTYITAYVPENNLKQ